jgi:hypothetical protein
MRYLTRSATKISLGSPIPPPTMRGSGNHVDGADSDPESTFSLFMQHMYGVLLSISHNGDFSISPVHSHFEGKRFKKDSSGYGMHARVSRGAMEISCWFGNYTYGMPSRLLL